MTRAQANELLTLYRNDLLQLPTTTINLCLYLTGDIE